MFLYNSVLVSIILIIFLVVVLLIIGMSYLFHRSITSRKIILKKIKEISIAKEGKFQTFRNSIYDYFLECKNTNYYIKIIYNYNADEICINSKYKWQILSNGNYRKQRFIPNLDSFIDFIPDLSEKPCIKLFIIYPNTKIIMRYINDCELEFVYPDTVLFGTNVVNFNDLDDNDIFF